MYVSIDFEVLDYCCRFGFLFKEKNFISKCVYFYYLKCDDCEMFLEILKIIEEVIDIIVFFNFDEKDDVKYVML